MTYQYIGPKKSKPPLEITDELKLWLARMAVGEGGENVSSEKTLILCWAITNRWFLWPGARYYRTYLSLMRAFVQGINPRWRRGGDLALKYIGRKAAAKGRLDRRDWLCSLKLYDIHSRVTETVEAFARGELPMPDRVMTLEQWRLSNWASKKNMNKKYPWGIDVDGDWAFEDKNLRVGMVEFARPALARTIDSRLILLERAVFGGQYDN